MASIITPAIFENDIALVIGGESNLSAGVQLAIDRYEPEYLAKMFGGVFTASFLSGLTEEVGGGFSDAFSDGFDIGGIDPRWSWFRDGHTYTFSNGSFVWVGLKKAIADYVYYRYRKDKWSHTGSTVNESYTANENSLMATPAHKMVDAWLDMIRINRDAYDVLCCALDSEGESLYPEYTTCKASRSFFVPINAMNL